MSRKKQKKRSRKCLSGHDSHHILHYRRNWSKGFKQQLRRSFIYDLPITVHQELHAIVPPVPPLDEEEARWLWTQFKAVDHDMSLFEALEWLQLHAPNAEFAMAIMAQYGFLRNKMG